MKIVKEIVIFVTLLTLPQTLAIMRNAEQDLIDYLFANYSKQARPVILPSISVNATFGIELVQLIKVDDRNQFVTTKMWVRQKWTNMLLKWDPKKFDNLTTVQVEGHLVWSPDIVLYNNADDSFTGGTIKYKTRISLHSDGTHVWLAPATFTSTCDIDIRYFPFDKQECKMKFGSWTFDKAGISLSKDIRPLITSQYVNSSEWDIVGTKNIINSVKYKCCKEPFMDVTFTLILLRKPLYYVFNVITPCLVLVTTILFGFFLPPESGERISLTITILLAVAVFLQLVSDALPRNSDNIPVLAIFYMVVMAESAFSLVTTCVVLIIHYRSDEKGTTPMPEWVKDLFLRKLAKYLGIRVTCNLEDGHFQDEVFHYDNKLTNINGSLNKSSNMENGDHKNQDNNGFYSNEFERRQSVELMMTERMKMRNGDGDETEENTLDGILNEVKMITSTIRHKQQREDTQEQWRILAKVLDRIFFWLFLLTVFLSAICILVPVYRIHH